jgi:Sigma-70, region 4
VVAPLLDKAILRLGTADQTALVLRFFRSQSLREIAVATGTSEEAARKRVSRAVDRLRDQLIAAGAPSAACTAPNLATLLARDAAHPVPAHLVAQALAAAAKSTGNVVYGPLLQGVLTMTATTKLVIVAGVAILLIAGSAGVVWVMGTDLFGASQPPAAFPSPPNAGAQTTTPAPVADLGWESRFNAAYSVAPGEAVRNILPPFIPERWTFSRRAWPHISNPQANGSLATQQILLRQDPSGVLSGYASGNPMPINALAANLADLWQWQIEGDPSLIQAPMLGDWVVRSKATPDQILTGIGAALSSQRGEKVTFTLNHPTRDVIVASGSARDNSVVNIRIYGKQSGTSSGDGPMGLMLHFFSDTTGIAMLDESNFAQVRHYVIAEVSDPALAKQTTDDLLESLADQTGLTFEHERRVVDVWTLSMSPQKQ